MVNIMKLKTIKGDWVVFFTRIMLNYLIIHFDWWITDRLINQNYTFFIWIITKNNILCR